MKDNKGKQFIEIKHNAPITCHAKFSPGQRWFRPMGVEMSFLLMGYDEAEKLFDALKEAGFVEHAMALRGAIKEEERTVKFHKTAGYIADPDNKYQGE